MGLAASQGRLLSLISRSHDINRQMLSLTRTKVSLANEVNAAAKEYQNGLSSKKMQWTTGALNTVDLNYNILMRPNTSNAKSPVLLTGIDGKVIVDEKYRKYAEMISPNGTSLGSYEGSTRTAILSELTGISEDVINDADTTSTLRNNAEAKFSDEENAFDKWLDAEDQTRGAGTKYLTVDEYGEKLGKTSTGVDLASLYKKNGELSFKTSDELKSYIESIKSNISGYFIDDKIIGCSDNTDFIAACDKTYNTYKMAYDDGSLKNGVHPGITYDDGVYKLNVQEVFKLIMTNYTGTSKTKSNNANEKTYPLRDTTSASYKNWYKELLNRHEALLNASAVYDATVEVANKAMTADQESMIQFYDNLFTAIADNGWTYNPQVNDSDYLNQMLQNNSYCLTTMTRNECYNDSLDESAKNWKYEYDTSLASDYDNIITVNDSDVASKALAKYEAEKMKINQKESKIDVKLKDLETEQAAIEQMIESIKKIKNDNIDRTFKLWS